MSEEQISDIGDQIAKNGKEDNSKIIEPGTTDAQKYRRLKAVYGLHKSMVKKNMHKAMSPLSSITGYLELIEMVLQDEENREQIEKYCSQIEEGVNEIGEIVEQLYEVFHQENIDEIEMPSNQDTVSKYNRPTG